MINSDVSKQTYQTVADQTANYPIPFVYLFNPATNEPELLVTLGGVELVYQTDYTLSSAGLQLTTEPEAGLILVILRNPLFEQLIDLQTGIIDPEQIEEGFDRSVMRDQYLNQSLTELWSHVDNDLAPVAWSSDYNDLINQPTIGAGVVTIMQGGVTKGTINVNQTGNTTINIDAPTAAQVTSVNGMVGAVVLDWQDVGAQAPIADLATIRAGAASGATAVQPGSLATVATTGSYNDLSNRPTIPTVGNGTITITQGGVTKGTFTTNQSGNTTIDVDAGGGSASFPDQTGHAGEFLTTDGSDVAWGDLATVATTGDYSDLINRPTNLVSTNTAQTISGMKTFSGDITLSGTTSIKNNTGGTNYTMLYRDATTIHVGASTSVLKLEGSGTRPAYNNDSLALLSDVTGGLPDQTGQSGKFLTTDGTDASWSDKPLVNSSSNTSALAIQVNNLGSATAFRSVGIGGTATSQGGISILGRATGPFSIAISESATASDYYSIAVGHYARATAVGAIQLGGQDALNQRENSDANTFKVGNANGNFEIMSADGTIPEARLADTTNAQQGDVLTLDANGDAVWQAGGSGGGLPSQTGNAGKFLTTDGTDASWSDKPLVNTATGTNSLAIGPTSVLQRNNCVIVGFGASASDAQGTVVGQGASAGYMASAFGYRANATAYAIQLGANKSNSDSNTFKVGNQNGNFEMMSADGTIPTARLTKVNTTITLTAAGWSSNTQTVSVTGMTATGVVLVSPDPTDQSAYTSAGILCTAQAAGSLTFTCDTVPSGDLSVNIVML